MRMHAELQNLAPSGWRQGTHCDRFNGWPRLGLVVYPGTSKGPPRGRVHQQSRGGGSVYGHPPHRRPHLAADLYQVSHHCAAGTRISSAPNRPMQPDISIGALPRLAANTNCELHFAALLLLLRMTVRFLAGVQLCKQLQCEQLKLCRTICVCVVLSAGSVLLCRARIRRAS